MRNFSALFLPVLRCCFLLLCVARVAHADPRVLWSPERCAALRQSNQPTLQVQQQLQQYCPAAAAKNTATRTASGFIPVQLENGTAEPAAPPPRVQHNSTLETLGSIMLLVLVGFWCWIGRK